MIKEWKVEAVRDYHVRRARDELDLAYRSDNRAASSAHLRLSALHMSRLRALVAPEPDGLIAAEPRVPALA